MENYYLRRGLAFLIDLFIIGLIAVIIGFIPIEKQFENITFILIIIIWFSKDIAYKKGSMGKHLLRLELKFNKPNSKYSFMIKILRNVTLLIWPIEAVLVLFSRKRIGDLIFGTSVHPLPKSNTL